MLGPMRPAPAIVILAAGASSRMGGADKLTRPVDGVPLLRRAAVAACAAAAEVVVVLPEGDAARAACLDALPARVARVGPRAMSASIRAGVAAVTAEAAMLHLADMPEIGLPEMRAVALAWRRGRAPVLRATTVAGAAGQPVVFARALFPALAALEGDRGARAVAGAHPAEAVALPGAAAVTDLDTPEAWAAWEARRG